MEPAACTPAAGWEKGQVENQVQDLHPQLFTPKLCFNDLESLNVWLFLRCNALGSRAYPEQKGQTIDEVFALERNEQRPLGFGFDGYLEKAVRVRSTCLVQYDSNRYSVPARYAGAISRCGPRDRLDLCSHPDNAVNFTGVMHSISVFRQYLLRENRLNSVFAQPVPGLYG